MLRQLYRWFVMRLGDLLTFIYVREYQAIGTEHVPAEGGVIVACNHLNNADPPFIARALGRPPVFMAKKEMLDVPLLGLAFRAWGAFPVRRGELDLNAIRTALHVLERGDMLLMFPEGTRSKSGGLGRAHPGTAMIALRAGVPILPVAITGTAEIKWPGFVLKPRSVQKIKVVVGEPFSLNKGASSTRAANVEAADEMMRRLAALLPIQHRGVYADQMTSPKAGAQEMSDW